MLNCARLIRLIVVAAAPVLATAQATPAKPSPQQRAQAPAAANTSTPQPASPDSRRFVTNANFLRAAVRSSSAPSNAAQQPVVAASISLQPALPQPTSTTSSASLPAVDHDASAAVDYASGQLTVVAERAPLGHVLKLIAGKTGATIDVAPELQQELVVAKLGPSPVREVLTNLLDSPRIDYIVFGTGDEPGSLQRIVVRRRQSFGNPGMGVMRSVQQEPAAEQPDPSGQISSRRNIPGQDEMTQEQRMQEWQKARAQMLEAEMKKQAQEHENDKIQPQEQAPPQETQQDNPPQI